MIESCGPRNKPSRLSAIETLLRITERTIRRPDSAQSIVSHCGVKHAANHLPSAVTSPTSLARASLSAQSA